LRLLYETFDKDCTRKAFKLALKPKPEPDTPRPSRSIATQVSISTPIVSNVQEEIGTNTENAAEFPTTVDVDHGNTQASEPEIPTASEPETPTASVEVNTEEEVSSVGSTSGHVMPSCATSSHYSIPGSSSDIFSSALSFGSVMSFSPRTERSFLTLRRSSHSFSSSARVNVSLILLSIIQFRCSI